MGDQVVVTLKFWHGGLFKDKPIGRQYVGGQARTFQVDIDELCWWYLLELVEKCGKYGKVEEIYYLLPNKGLKDGLMRVYTDKEVLEMAEVVLKYRSIELFVLHGVDQPVVLTTPVLPLPPSSKVVTPQKNKAQMKAKAPAKSAKPMMMHKSPASKNDTQNPNSITLRSSPRLKNTQSKTNNPVQSQPNNPEQTQPDLQSTISTEIPHTQQSQTAEKPHTQKSQKTQTGNNVNHSNVTKNPLEPTECTGNNREEDYDFYDNRPESPLKWDELIGEEYLSSDGSDEAYQPEEDSDGSPLPNPAPTTVAKKTSAPLNPAPAPAAKKTSVPANRRAEKQPVASEPVGKRARTSTTSEPPTQQSSVHFDATAQPTRTGKNGRVIYTGKGSRGGGRGSRGRGGGRGRGRGRGVGVLFGIDGTPFMQVSSNLVDLVVL
ncbi:hypothetical protein SOVF_149160 [Spinacia oleracea]|nr:hypothetical protein SOVF_149160 [Spinacia oleracea]